MLAKLLTIPNGGSIVVKFPFKKKNRYKKINSIFSS